MAVACLSWTITKTKAFKPLRKKLKWEVLECPYCLSFWVALPFAFLLVNPMILNFSLFYYVFLAFINELLLVWLAAFQWSLLAMAWKKLKY